MPWRSSMEILMSVFYQATLEVVEKMLLYQIIVRNATIY